MKAAMLVSIVGLVLLGALSGCQTGRAPGAESTAPSPDSAAHAAAGDPFAAPGFVTLVSPRDGRLWVFREGSPQLAAYRAEGEPAQQVLVPGAGPGGMTLKSHDRAVIDAYLAARDGAAATAPPGDRYAAPGFVTFVSPKDGRLWVFREGSDELRAYHADGEPAKQILRVGAGPGGITIKAPDSDVIEAYLAARGRGANR